MEAEKLAEFHANLEAIQEVLQDDPTNEELLSVKRDLEEVIRYYTESAGGISKAAASQDPTKGDFARENAPSGAREETLKGDEMTNKAKGLIGRTCVISSDFKHGTISSLGELDADSGMPKTILVRLLDDAGTVKELDVAKVRLINQCDPSSFEEGSEMQALYNDGVWYDCTIKKIRVSRVVVYYQDYDEEDELPLDRVSLRSYVTPYSMLPPILCYLHWLFCLTCYVTTPGFQLRV
ncbi:hypothetical protein GNI_018360 [Gregarina niphandrodes]|uniref:Tudor domain-containing protein n=1 Tax=Gregarina niphandrodes TaxID=110365 RepID=A0A023BC72_GRENI|nr:hypothetical protein GNI_018360 [Gregarina niphandrodes]EZG81694.1 hypothetical protein GNI_018360 [Gregarina niphandrodes]|eukprot:XP_011134200.1 hypothetical protein GNI_018360 [Gregarina niphandrodes]